MAIPEHVKKQAMDAVAHKETTGWIRHYSNDNAPGQIFNQAPRDMSVSALPDQVKKQAMDAVASFRRMENISTPEGKPSSEPPIDKKAAMDAVNHKNTKAYIELVASNDISSPMATPGRESIKSQQIAQMYSAGRDADAVHKSVTKDDFAREP